MVRYYPSNDRSALPGHFGFLPGNTTAATVVSSRVFSAKIPDICRSVTKNQPFGMLKGENGLNYGFATFLLEIVVVICFIKLITFLLRPLRQPRVVCEIIGGIMVGPSVLGGSRNFNYYMFPPIGNYLFANLGLLGFFYFLFLTGAKTDVDAIWKSPRKHKFIAAISVTAPMFVVGTVGIVMRNNMENSLKKSSAIGGVAFTAGFTSFPCIYTVLRDMNLLNSEVGKLAMSVALLGSMAAVYVLVFFEAMTQADGGGATAVIWFLFSVVIFCAFMLLVVKRTFAWVVTQTPEGKLVNQNYISLILMGVLVSGFLTDMFGLSIGVGPIWLGLLVPHGPPLGSTLSIRSETFIHDFLLPFSFAWVGLNTNLNFIGDATWPDQVAPLLYLTLVAIFSKFVSTTAAALLFKIPTRDSLTLGLMMNLRGQMDILIYLHWIDKRIVEIPGFSIMVLHAVLVTGIATPIISFLYDPTRPYRSSKHRTIQHTPQDAEMGLVLAVSDNQTFSGLITFLDLTYPTTTSPFCIYAVQLVELMGRATPMFIDHELRREEEVEDEEDIMEEDDELERSSGRVDQVQSAFRLYQEKREETVKLRGYTANAPKRLMYQDLCELALTKKTAFILLPYQKERLEDTAQTELRDSGMLCVNSDVLEHAPCSVCIYYDKGHLRNPWVRSSFDQQHSANSSHVMQETYRVVVLFLGGADNREALHLTDRITANPDITLTVIRFLSHNHEGEDEREKKLDDGVVTWFWVKNESNDRVSYKEVVVKNGAETLAAIQAMNVNDYDLWITGRREGINPKILEGLSTWSEDHQLGVIGDTVAGSVFASEGSVLVVQQQVMNKRGGDGFLNGKFDYKSYVSPFSRNN